MMGRRRGALGSVMIAVTALAACTAIVDTRGLAGGPADDAASPVEAGPPDALDAPKGACAGSASCAGGARCISAVCVPGEGLLAWWSFEQMTSQVLDVSGNGNHGTSYQTQPAPGKMGMGIKLDANACVLVPESPSLELADAQALTMMAWARVTGCPGSGSDHGIILNKEDTYELGVQCNGLVLQEALNTGVWSWHGSAALTQASWQHVALTWDGSNVSYYVDGQLRDSHSQMGRIVAHGSGLGIGCRDVGVTGSAANVREWIDGTIDELALYGRALSPAELGAYYEATR